MTFTTGLLIIAAVLAVAAIPVVHRIVVGPTILDRAVATDMLVVLLVMAMALEAVARRSVHAGAAMLSMTALAFLSTIAVARFVAREDADAADAPQVGTPEHEAISDPGEAVEAARDEGQEGAHADR